MKILLILKKTLENLNVPVGFSWLLRPEPKLEPNKRQAIKLNSIESTINTDVCKQFVKAKQFDAVRTYIFDKYFITDDIILKIAEESIGQSKSEMWHYHRKNRLTTSHFGHILSSCKKQKFSKSFFKSLQNDTNLSGIHAIQWGLTNEISGIKVLEQEQNVKVISTGLWLLNT